MDDVQNSEDLSPQDANKNAPLSDTRQPKTMAQRLLRIFMVLGILLSLLATSVFIAAQSERGTRLLWRTAKVLSVGHVQAQWVSGTLAKGGSAEFVRIHLSTVHIDIHELSSAWQWEVLPVRWNVPHIAAQRVDISIFPSTKESTDRKSVV